MATTLRWLGHGCWLVAAGKTTILVDPFLNDSPTAPVKADGVKADYVLVSHGHFDHVADAAFGRVKMTIAHHSSVLPDGSGGGNPGGFVLSLADGTVYFACDTGLFYDMKLIGAGGLDLAVLPIGDRFTMGPDDAVEAVKLLKPKRVVPSHYNTWPPIAQDTVPWVDRIKAETDAQPIVIAPGETITL